MTFSPRLGSSSCFSSNGISCSAGAAGVSEVTNSGSGSFFLRVRFLGASAAGSAATGSAATVAGSAGTSSLGCSSAASTCDSGLRASTCCTVLLGLWLLALSCSCISESCSSSVPTVATTCSLFRLSVFTFLAARFTPRVRSRLAGTPAARRASSLACTCSARLSACASRMA